MNIFPYENVSIPIKFFGIKYNASVHPINTNDVYRTPTKLDGLKNGANCQNFVYEILTELTHQNVPELRSKELWDWEPHHGSIQSDTLQPMDIVFFNDTNEAYGAHLGIYIGSNKVMHLCKEVGYPTVWDFEEFKKRDRYKVYLGHRRLNEF